MKRSILLLLIFFSLSFGFSQTISSAPTTALESDLDKDVNLDGDKSDTVYLISTLAELLWISEKVRDESYTWSQQKIFLQTADIDASETKYWDDATTVSDGNLYNDSDDATSAGNNEGWYPIGMGRDGSINIKFNGFYNGNYHRILNLSIKRSASTSANSIGFIGEMGSYNTTGHRVGLVKLGIINGNYEIETENSSTQVGGLVGGSTGASATKRLTIFFLRVILN